MAFNYAGLRSTADSLISKFGSSMVMKAVADGVFDRESGTVTQTETDVSVTAVLFESKSRWLDGTLVKRGDRRAIVKAGGLSTVPKIGYYLITDSAGRYYIDEVEPLTPDDSTTLLYALTLKQGGEESSEWA